MTKTNSLTVFLWGKEIGRLSFNGRQYYFFFSKEYFDLPYDLTPLISPKQSPEAHSCILGNTDDKIYHGLPPFIADSLPDAWGNAVFDRWFADEGLREADKDNIARLSFIGRRAMGALEFVPEMPLGQDSGRVDLEALYAEALAFERSLYGAKADETELSISRLAAMGTSAGGRQKKAIVALDKDGVFHSGQIEVDPSWRRYILKFNTPRYCLSEIEYAYHGMLNDVGITTMPSTLVDICGTKCFLTQRFDRCNGEKVYTQTLAALMPGASSYEDLLAAARALSIPKAQISELFVRAVFNILGNNTDDHSKNFSFIMSKDGRWSLAPAYDVNFIIGSTGIRPEIDHCLTLRGKTSGFTLNDLLAFARENDIVEPMNLIDKTAAVLTRFDDYAQEAGIRSDIKEMISVRLRELREEFDGVKAKSGAIKVKLIVGGKEFRSVRFERTEKGNVHLYATTGGLEYKHVFVYGSKMEKRIAQNGFNSMPLKEKAKLVEKYILPKVE